MKTNVRLLLLKVCLILIALGMSVSTYAQKNKSSGSRTLLPFTEDWSSYSFATNGWTFDPESSTCWVIQQNFGNPLPTAEFNYYALPFGAYETSLVSPSLDATALTGNNLILKYNYYKDSPGSWTTDSMAVEINNGSGWQRLSVYGGGDGDQWIIGSANISSFAVGNNFQIRFRCFGPTDAHYKWRMDNIQIYQAPAGIGNIAGTITKQMNGSPIKGVTVVASNTQSGKHITTTSDNGTYIFNGLETGDYTITCTKYNYTTVNDNVTITANQTTTKNYQMVEILPSLLIEDWSSQSFATNGWTFSPNQGNWQIDNYYGNPVPGISFSNQPALTDYEYSLVSPSIDATLLTGNIILKYDIMLYNFDPSTLENLAIEVYDGTTWQTIKQFNNTAGSFDWINDSLNITSITTGHIFSARFRAYGQNSSMNYWIVDNIRVYEGEVGSGNIAGTVTLASNGSPIEGATVTLNNTLLGTFSTTTAADGTYSINNITEGNYAISCVKNGYTVINDNVTITPNLTLTKDFQMSVPTVLLNESWSSYNFTTNGWTFDPESSTCWVIQQNFGNPLPSAEFNYYALPLGAYNTSLVSPLLDATALTGNNLIFKYNYYWENSSLWTTDSLAVEINDGSGWQRVTAYGSGSSVGTGDQWITNSFNISSLASGHTFQVRFRCFGSTDAHFEWRIDNIQIYQASAGTGNLAGTITKQSNGTPVKGVSVVATNAQTGIHTTTTTDDGTYSFNGLETGDYSINCTKFNYMTISDNATITANQTTTKDYQMVEILPSLLLEDWSSNSFTSNGWTFLPSQGNWGILAWGNPSPGAVFLWNPEITNYDYSLVSPTMDATTLTDNIIFKYDISLDNYDPATLENMDVDVYDGTSWQTVKQYNNTAGSFAWLNDSINITSMITGHTFNIRFRAYGQNSANLNGWGIDNIRVYEAGVGNIAGMVTQTSNGAPIEGALISLNNRMYSTTSDANGNYTINGAISGSYSITCVKNGYITYNDNVTIPTNQTLTKNIQLAIGNLFVVNPDTVNMEVPAGQTISRELALTNYSNNPFTWNATINFNENKGTSEHNLWDTLFNFNAAGDNLLESDGEYIYTCRRNFSSFRKYDKNGNFLDEFSITNCWSWGMVYDGQYFYTVNNGTDIYQIDMNTHENLGDISTPIAYLKGITCDPQTGNFWVSDEHSIYLVDRSGNILKSDGLTGLTNIRGLAYDSWTPGGPYLWISDITGNGGIYQYGITAGKLTGMMHGNGTLDMCMSDKIVPGKVTLIGFVPTGGISGKIIGYDMGASSTSAPWAKITPATDTIPAGQSQTVTVTFDGNYLPQQKDLTVTGEIHFTSTPNVGSPVIPLNMTIAGEIAGRLNGIVSHGNIPVEGVTVKAYRKEAPVYIYSTTTGTDGNYSFPSAGFGTYDIYASKDGYNPYSASITVTGGQTTTQNISLLAPVMVTNPLIINDSATAEQVKTTTLHIANNGDGMLTWNGTVFQTISQQKVFIPASNDQFEKRIETTSILQSPVTSAKIPAGSSRDLTGASVAYGFDSRTGGKSTFLKFNPENPSDTNVIANLIFPSENSPTGGTFDATSADSMYIMNMTDDGVRIYLRKIDVTTGNYRMLGRIFISDYQTPTGLTCDKTTGIIYAASTGVSALQSYIYRIDPVTGANTCIGATNIPCLISITVDGTGQMYGYDLEYDQAYKIDKETGASTLLGSIGFDANYAQGFCWDPATDMIYMSAYNAIAGPEMRIFDRTTGNTSLISALPGGIGGLAFAGIAPQWLNMEPKNGTIAPGESQDVTVTLDGNYVPYQNQKNFVLNGNIALSPLPEIGNITLPVTFKIIGNIGLLSGTVTHAGAPMEGIPVKAVREGSPVYTYNIVTGADGTYTFPDMMYGNYTVTATREGYNPYSTSVYVAGNGQPTVHNIVLTNPTMDLNVSSISESIDFGQVMTVPVTITNNGDGPLTWNGIVNTDNKMNDFSIPASDGNFPHGTSPLSLGRVPISSHKISSSDNVTDLLKGVNAYAFNIDNDYRLFSFNTSDPSLENYIGNPISEAYAGAFDAEHENFMYIVDSYNSGHLLKVDVTTGTVLQDIGYLAPVYSGQTWTGISFDKTTGILYGASTDLADSYIYTINPETAETNWIGINSTGIPGLIDITIDNKGQMYGYDIVDDNAYKIDKSTGVATVLGSIGFDANYSQGMGYDPVNNLIYLAAYNDSNGEAELRIMDPANGNTKLEGSFSATEVDALAFPGAVINWLTISPKTGTIPAGASMEVTVTLNGNYIPPQKNNTLTGSINFTSDPNVGTVTIPVTLVENGNDGVLTGTVIHDGVAVSDVTITAAKTGYEYTATTGNDGVFTFPQILVGSYEVTAEATGYNLYSTTGVVITGNQTTTLPIVLTTPVMNINPSSLIVTVPAGQTTDQTITIGNPGDGDLEWNATFQINNKQRISIPASDGNFEHEPAFFGPAPLVKKTTATTSSLKELLRSTTAYAFDINNNKFFSFDTDNPADPTIISSISIAPFGGTFDEIHADFMYVVDYNDGKIKKVDVATGNITIVGSAGLQSGDTPTGLTCDKTNGTLYASSTNGSESTIYTIDPVTGASTIIGATGIPVLIDIAVDGNGQMYGYDASGDNAYKIDKATGVSTFIGSIGFDASYAQGMAWDPTSDNIYLAGFNVATSAGELRILDRETGNTSLVGSFAGETDGLAFPGGGSWLSVDPKHGVIPADNSQNVTVHFDATELVLGVYTASITLTSNPDVGTVTIPITLNVVNPGPQPTLTIGTITDAQAGAIFVPVHAANIVNMGSFQFTIEYDPSLMIYTGTSNWYTGIDAVTIGNPASGKLTFVWAADAEGINIPDGNFFNVDFTWMGSTLTSPLIWNDNPTPREFTDYDGNIFIPTYINGSITGGNPTQPVLSVTPANQDVTANAGTTTFVVANTGVGTMNYTAAVTTGNDWLTITSGGSGVNTGTINVSYTENTSTSPRTGTITVTAPGATGSPVQVTVTQAAASVPAAIVTITDTTTLVSGLFVVPVRAQNITNMGSFQFTIEYDPSIILFDSITNWHAGIDAVTTGNPSAGHITFVWAADLNGINIADGNFFDINFDWIASDVIQTQVNWSDNPTPREFADYDGNIFVPMYNNGTETGPDGIPEIGSSSIKVFPNPATDVVNITVSNDISTVQVMNYLGMVVYSENIAQEKTIMLNTSRYSAGNYLVRFVTNSGQTLIKKMVIIK